jgi:hypothetical protein
MIGLKALSINSRGNCGKVNTQLLFRVEPFL